MNYIYNSLNSTKVSISKKSLEMLKSKVPKDCPFNDYTLVDLLYDFIKMYSWKVRGKMSLVDFIKKLKEEGYSYAVAYGDAMIAILDN